MPTEYKTNGEWSFGGLVTRQIARIASLFHWRFCPTRPCRKTTSTTISIALAQNTKYFQSATETLAEPPRGKCRPKSRHHKITAASNPATCHRSQGATRFCHSFDCFALPRPLHVKHLQSTLRKFRRHNKQRAYSKQNSQSQQWHERISNFL